MFRLPVDETCPHHKRSQRSGSQIFRVFSIDYSIAGKDDHVCEKAENAHLRKCSLLSVGRHMSNDEKAEGKVRDEGCGLLKDSRDQGSVNKITRTLERGSWLSLTHYPVEYFRMGEIAEQGDTHLYASS